MNMIAANGAGGGEYDCIADVFLFDHFLNPGEQVRVVFESQNNDSLEMAVDGVDFRTSSLFGLASAAGVWEGLTISRRVS